MEEEEEGAVAQATAALDEQNKFANELGSWRKREDEPVVPPGSIDVMDVAPEQLVSIVAVLFFFFQAEDGIRDKAT